MSRILRHPMPTVGDDQKYTHAEWVRLRGVEDPDDACKACHGLGRRAYGSTATWKGGMGGQAITGDVCDRCWGSGDEHRHGADLRALLCKDRHASHRALALTLVDAASGAWLESLAPGVRELASHLRDQAKKSSKGDRPRGYAQAADCLARLLDEAVDAAEKRRLEDAAASGPPTGAMP